MLINNIQTENGVSNIMSNLCKQYVENELNCYKKKLYDITNEIHSTEIELKTVDKNLIKLNKEKDWSEDIFHSLISLKQTDNIRLQTLQDSKYELNNKINFLNNQKKDVETKIEELINILRDDDSNVSRETMSDSIHDNVKLIDFIELDRKRISRDIHDSVVQNLTALIHKQEFISQIINTDITRSKLEINNSVVLIKESINELRNIIYELRPMSVDDLGFKNAIMNMIDKFNRESNVITYYSSINFDDELMEQAKSAVERVYTCIDNLEFLLQNSEDRELADSEKEYSKTLDDCKTKFIAAMDDDLNTADAIAAIFDIVYASNTALSNENKNAKAVVEKTLDLIHELGGVLGLFQKTQEKSIDAEVEELIEKRNKARSEKNWAEADAIRDKLKAMNIELKDTPMGVKWNYISE